MNARLLPFLGPALLLGAACSGSSRPPDTSGNGPAPTQPGVTPPGTCSDRLAFVVGGASVTTGPCLGGGTPRGLAIQGDTFVYGMGDVLCAARSAEPTLLVTAAGLTSFRMDGARVLYLHAGGVSAVPVAGGDATAVLTFPTTVQRLAAGLAADAVYTVEDAAGRILLVRTKLAGGERETLGDAPPGITRLVPTASGVYLANEGAAGRVFRWTASGLVPAASLDGLDPRVLGIDDERAIVSAVVDGARGPNLLEADGRLVPLWRPEGMTVVPSAATAQGGTVYWAGALTAEGAPALAVVAGPRDGSSGRVTTCTRDLGSGSTGVGALTVEGGTPFVLAATPSTALGRAAP